MGDLADAWDELDAAIQRAATSQPHRITESFERLEKARLRMRPIVQTMLSAQPLAKPMPMATVEVVGRKMQE